MHKPSDEISFALTYFEDSESFGQRACVITEASVGDLINNPHHPAIDQALETYKRALAILGQGGE